MQIPLFVFDLQKTEFDWQYYAEKSDKASKSIKNGSYWPRGKLLGGSSAINLMLYIRGNSKDYDYWEELGNPTWDYKSVLEYFKKSEHLTDNWFNEITDGYYHGTEGELKVSPFRNILSIKTILYEAAFELGYIETMDANAHQTVGFNTALGNIYYGMRCSSATAFLVPAKRRPNFDVIKYAHVTKIELNDEGKADTVKFKIDGKQMIAKAKKEIVLSAGAINTPQILILSGIGPEDHLKTLGIKTIKDLPVGKNLQDHLIVPYVLTFHKSRCEKQSLEELSDWMYMYAMHRVGPLSSIGATDLIGFINTLNNTEGQFPDIQMMYASFKKQAPQLKSFLDKLGYIDEIIESIVDASQDAEVVLCLVTLLNPKSVGKIELRSNNPFEMPKIFANYLDEQEDVDTVLRGIRLKQKFLTTKNFEMHQVEEVKINIPGCSDLESDSDEYWECYIRHMSTTVYHPVGTAKMGPDSDKEAVVDSQLRVKGIKGLRVADASIMPKIISGNTNAPTVMIGEKAADFIKQEWATVKHSEL